MGKCCYHFSALIFRWIFFILAGNKTNYKSLDEFEFLQYSITDFWVSCPWAYEKSLKNVVITLALSYLIGYSSFFQAARTPIKFGQIGPWTVELAALKHLENLNRLIMGEMFRPL